MDRAKVKALHGRAQLYQTHRIRRHRRGASNPDDFSASTDFSRVKEDGGRHHLRAHAAEQKPRAGHSFILNTGRSIAPHLNKGLLVVLESTTYPGTTDEDLRARAGSGSGLKAGADFHLAFSPEREDPGNPDSKVALIPKVIGGLTPACLERAKAVYGLAIKTLVPVSSCRVAEAAKLTENIFRSVNIALVNELKIVYTAMGIDVWEVINAAKTKPFGFMPFYPGPGLGGHCIPIDPFLLDMEGPRIRQNTRFIELAGEINTAMPDYVVHQVVAALNATAKSPQRLQGARSRPGLQGGRGR